LQLSNTDESFFFCLEVEKIGTRNWTKQKRIAINMSEKERKKERK
jgi:hypothetical protein